MNEYKYLILPEPKEITYSEGCFDLSGCSISVSEGLDPRVIAKAVALKTAISQKTGIIPSFYRASREDSKRRNPSKRGLYRYCYFQ